MVGEAQPNVFLTISMSKRILLTVIIILIAIPVFAETAETEVSFNLDVEDRIVLTVLDASKVEVTPKIINWFEHYEHVLSGKFYYVYFYLKLNIVTGHRLKLSISTIGPMKDKAEQVPDTVDFTLSYLETTTDGSSSYDNLEELQSAYATIFNASDYGAKDLFKVCTENILQETNTSTFFYFQVFDSDLEGKAITTYRTYLTLTAVTV